MGLKNVIAEFFSAESGQERRQWLTGKEEQFGNALGYALGPDLAPRVNALAQAGAMVSPGADVMEAQQAGRDMFAPDRSIMDRAASGAAMVGAGAMMLMPGGASSVRQGVESVVDAGVRAYDPSIVGSNAGNAIPDIPATPAQEIARLLSEGRANEVTDELYAQADPQELHQLYTSGATGVDMPMDTPSRMARADEMGFDSDAFHGTTSDFAAPKAGMDFYTTPNFDYANIYAGSQFDEGGRVLPVMQRQGAILDTRTADGRQTFDDGFFMQYGNGTPITDKGVPDWTEGPDFGEMFSDNNLPYAGVFLDEGKVPLGDGTLLDRGVSTLHLDPSNIRSKFARFDPRLSNLRNLSAGVAGAGAVGLAAQSRQPEERRELPPLAPELAFMKDIYR
jgi:hypothetical protein